MKTMVCTRISSHGLIEIQKTENIYIIVWRSQCLDSIIDIPLESANNCYGAIEMMFKCLASCPTIDLSRLIFTTYDNDFPWGLVIEKYKRALLVNH